VHLWIRNNISEIILKVLSHLAYNFPKTNRYIRVRKWSQDRKWSRTANDPQIGPQMIPDRKWSPYWTANDPNQKIRNGMDGGIVWIGNWRTWIPMFLSKPSYNYNGLQLAFFHTFDLILLLATMLWISPFNHQLGFHFFAILSKIMISATYATYPPLLNIDIWCYS